MSDAEKELNQESTTVEYYDEKKDKEYSLEEEQEDEEEWLKAYKILDEHHLSTGTGWMRVKGSSAEDWLAYAGRPSETYGEIVDYTPTDIWIQIYVDGEIRTCHLSTKMFQDWLESDVDAYRNLSVGSWMDQLETAEIQYQ